VERALGVPARRQRLPGPAGTLADWAPPLGAARGDPWPGSAPFAGAGGHRQPQGPGRVERGAGDRAHPGGAGRGPGAGRGQGRLPGVCHPGRPARRPHRPELPGAALHWPRLLGRRRATQLTGLRGRRGEDRPGHAGQALPAGSGQGATAGRAFQLPGGAHRQPRRLHRHGHGPVAGRGAGGAGYAVVHPGRIGHRPGAGLLHRPGPGADRGGGAAAGAAGPLAATRWPRQRLGAASPLPAHPRTAPGRLPGTGPG
jgi:hypothetical protein